MESMEIDIVLSTYNPEIIYLEKLLKSISNQRVVAEKFNIHINLYWRDDFSFNYEKIYSAIKKSKIYLKYIEKGSNRLGFLESYNKLFSKTTSNLVFLCDQDDIWDKNKILKMVHSYVLNFENETEPVVIFSDCDCIDEKDMVIQKKFNLFYGFQPSQKVTQFFFRNFVPGCTMMVNRILLEKYMKSKNLIQLHDHTILHIAAIFGKIHFIPNSLTLYRIHKGNTLGFIKRPIKSKIYDLFNLIRYYYRKDQFWQKVYPNHINQIQYFYELKDFEMIRKYIEDYQLINNFLIKKTSKTSNGAIIANGMDLVQKWVYRFMS
jgi:hypothetical protein